MGVQQISRFWHRRLCEASMLYAVIIVALSIVILAPISQLGCFKARAAVTFANSSMGVVRKGPPEAVRRILSMALPSSPTKLWKIALCSESTGMS